VSLIDREDIDKRNLLLISGSFIVLVFLIAVIILTQRHVALLQQVTLLGVTLKTVQITSGNTIKVSNQAAGVSVITNSASLVKSGYIVIHELKDGKLGPVIGHSALQKSGAFKKVVVRLDRPSVSGEILFAMLHDDDGDRNYEFPGDDVPTKNNTGEIVVVPFLIQ